MTTLGIRLATIIAVLCSVPLSAHCREPHWPEVLTIGTASPGGTYYVYGEGLARILTRELKTTVWAKSTGGPTENIKLLENGEIQLGFVTLGVAQQGWNGTGEWTNGTKYRIDQRHEHGKPGDFSHLNDEELKESLYDVTKELAELDPVAEFAKQLAQPSTGPNADISGREGAGAMPTRRE